MAAPNPHVMIAAVDFIAKSLGAVGRNTNYIRDYRGVRRYLYDFPIEADLKLPWIQLEVGDPTTQESLYGNEISNTRFRHQLEVFVQVHVVADKLHDGELDVNTPKLNTQADIHRRMFLDRTQSGNVLHTHYANSESKPWGIDGHFGVTLLETYLLEYDHLSGDMSAV